MRDWAKRKIKDIDARALELHAITLAQDKFQHKTLLNGGVLPRNGFLILVGKTVKEDEWFAEMIESETKLRRFKAFVGDAFLPVIPE